MEIPTHIYETRRNAAQALYAQEREIWCPYFKESVSLTSDGFHHLQFSARRERKKMEQLLKFRLLPYALEAIRKSATVQECRELLTPVGKKKNGTVPMKRVEYWGFIAILGDEKKVKVKAILRRIGDGKITFWSVMPFIKIKNGQQRLHSRGMEDE